MITVQKEEIMNKTINPKHIIRIINGKKILRNIIFVLPLELQMKQSMQKLTYLMEKIQEQIIQFIHNLIKKLENLTYHLELDMNNLQLNQIKNM